MTRFWGAKHFLARIFLRQATSSTKPIKNRILVLVDADNIFMNTKDPSDDAPSMRFPEKELDALMAKLGKIGEFMPIFVFAPRSTLDRYGEQIARSGFIAVQCPVMVRDKGTEVLTSKEDTVDPTLMFFGRKVIPLLKQAGLTHVCLASADGHFTSFLREEVVSLGLNLILVAGNTNINSDLSQLVSSCEGQIFTLYEQT